VIRSPATRCVTCWAIFSQRSASSSSLVATSSLAFAPRPAGLAPGDLSEPGASLVKRSIGAPVARVSFSTSTFASPEPRRIAHEAANDISPTGYLTM
jgi:hypothetical protein